MSSKERRNKRSEVTVEAVLFQLQHCESTYDLDALMMVDINGLSFTSRLEFQDSAEVLAAYAPLLWEADGEQTRTRLMAALEQDLPDIQDRRITVERFELEGEFAYLVGLTRNGETPPAVMAHAITGIRRIIGVAS